MDPHFGPSSHWGLVNPWLKVAHYVMMQLVERTEIKITDPLFSWGHLCCVELVYTDRTHSHVNEFWVLCKQKCNRLYFRLSRSNWTFLFYQPESSPSSSSLMSDRSSRSSSSSSPNPPLPFLPAGETGKKKNRMLLQLWDAPLGSDTPEFASAHRWRGLWRHLCGPGIITGKSISSWDGAESRLQTPPPLHKHPWQFTAGNFRHLMLTA